MCKISAKQFMSELQVHQVALLMANQSRSYKLKVESLTKGTEKYKKLMNIAINYLYVLNLFLIQS